MCSPFHFPKALRRIFLLSAVFALLAGLPGLAGSGAWTGARDCELTCPCDAQERGESLQTEGPAHDSCGDEIATCGLHEESPGEEPCRDNCPDCDCFSGYPAGPLPEYMGQGAAPSAFSIWMHRSDFKVATAMSGVFRPPRVHAP